MRIPYNQHKESAFFRYMKKLIHAIAAFLMLTTYSIAQNTTNDGKEGWKFGGALPAIAFNSDEGFRYGILGYVYDYGDGTYYPNFKKSIYTEISRTTGGGGINNIVYDDTHFLGSNIRLVLDFNYKTEKALDFYGFNGYQANYNHDFEDQDSPNYISSVYYRTDRKMYRALLSLRGTTGINNLKWYGGILFCNQKIAAPDIDKLNKRRSSDEQLPPATESTSLYLDYVSKGYIRSQEANGGTVTMLQGGIVYDSRDNQSTPSLGTWGEIYLGWAPGTLGTSRAYTMLNASMRQYYSILNKRLTFTYRISYNTLLGGTMPFYMMPFYYDSRYVADGIGGAKTVRGIRRNRIQGNGYIFANIETRWKFVETKLFAQDIYLALLAYFDTGRVTREYKTDAPIYQKENFHNAAGTGFRIGINNNFIVGIVYGHSFDKQDGDKGVYIDVGWLW